jgi:hypothetical protein
MKRGENMSKREGESEVLQKVLERLQYIDPPIKKFPVTSEDPAMAVCFLDLKDVCYNHEGRPRAE